MNNRLNFITTEFDILFEDLYYISFRNDVILLPDECINNVHVAIELVYGEWIEIHSDQKLFNEILKYFDFNLNEHQYMDKEVDILLWKNKLYD